MTEQATLRTGDVAEALGVSATAVRRWARLGLLTPAFVTPGGHRRYTRAALEAFVHDRASGNGNAEAAR